MGVIAFELMLGKVSLHVKPERDHIWGELVRRYETKSLPSKCRSREMRFQMDGLWRQPTVSTK
jgi:hypothetical protein